MDADFCKTSAHFVEEVEGGTRKESRSSEWRNFFSSMDLVGLLLSLLLDSSLSEESRRCRLVVWQSVDVVGEGWFSSVKIIY